MLKRSKIHQELKSSRLQTHANDLRLERQRQKQKQRQRQEHFSQALDWKEIYIRSKCLPSRSSWQEHSYYLSSLQVTLRFSVSCRFPHQTEHDEPISVHVYLCVYMYVCVGVL